MSIPTGRAPGRQLVCVNFADGLTSADFYHNGSLILSKGYTPGDGWADGRLVSATSTLTAVRGLIYYKTHTTEERQAIERYLGNKYGISVV